MVSLGGWERSKVSKEAAPERSGAVEKIKLVLDLVRRFTLPTLTVLLLLYSATRTLHNNGLRNLPILLP